MINNEPRWLIEARKNIGVTEIKGAKHNPEIVSSGGILSAVELKTMKRRGAQHLSVQCWNV